MIFFFQNEALQTRPWVGLGCLELGVTPPKNANYKTEKYQQKNVKSGGHGRGDAWSWVPATPRNPQWAVSTVSTEAEAPSPHPPELSCGQRPNLGGRALL